MKTSFELEKGMAWNGKDTIASILLVIIGLAIAVLGYLYGEGIYITETWNPVYTKWILIVIGICIPIIGIPVARKQRKEELNSLIKTRKSAESRK